VAGRGRRAQGQAGFSVDLRTVAVARRYALEGDAGSGRHEVGGARDPGELQATGDVVVVDVPLDDVGDPHPAPSGRRDHLVDVSRWVDRHRRALTAGETAAVAEPRHLDRVDEEHEVLPFQ
jgi:hypothetical protein